MARRFRREKLAPEPRAVRGWRTVTSGSHRVRIALLPGGGTHAVALLHPIGENPSARHPRHCRVCGRVGHDRRKHRRER